MKILALADLHLRENKPECRAEEEDWLKAVFFILCFWLYGGVGKLLVKYGEELIKERKNEK